MTLAVAYLRTSTASNVGTDKDSDKRQLAAIKAYAQAHRIEVVQPPFYDTAVSGADPIQARPGFADLLAYLQGHSECRVVLVETASRFARDLMTQEAGHQFLRSQGIDLVAVDSPQAFVDDTPTAVLIRQVLGAVAQFDKAMTVAKLRGARERKRLATGKKVGGRQSLAERVPEAVALARKLYRKNPHTGRRRGLPTIAAALEADGHVNEAGNRYQVTAVRRMLGLSA